MFGLTFSGQLIQGSAERTWNCISQIANLVWYKFNHFRQPIMPRPRRKHHSRSRSRSHSHDKDRDAKRRKIEVYDSPNHKRSVSPPIDPTKEEKHQDLPKSEQTGVKTSKCSNDVVHDSGNVIVLESDSGDAQSDQQSEDDIDMRSSDTNSTPNSKRSAENSKILDETKCGDDKLPDSSNVILLDSDSEDAHSPRSATEVQDIDTKPPEINSTPTTNINSENSKINCDNNSDSKSNSSKSNDSRDEIAKNTNTPVSNSVQRLFQEKTPTRRLTPKQLEKKLESEKKRQLKEKEKEEREKQKQLEKEQKDAEKQKKKEQKQKDIELKQKEKEEKEEQKRQEKELKLKQKEEDKIRKQQEIDEKNKEKLKEEEKKQKAAAAFVNFFVPKKTNATDEKKNEEISIFMPFEVKCDMKLPPPRRQPLSSEERIILEKLVENNKMNCSFLKDLKTSKSRSCPKTWINIDSDDDVLIVEEESLLGETICEEKLKTERMRVKLLQFHENQRPAYYGTWRKKSKNITGRRPLVKEDVFDYDVDSDDDWEEEEQGENLEVMSEEEKENEPENEDYEVDNEFFVPHGHLSDDEVDDEENAKLSPESQKEKLKLLKDAFDQDIKSKTHKIKPRSIGCIWYNKDGNNIDEAIDKYLHPLNIITNGRIEIKKRDLAGITGGSQKNKKAPRPLPDNLMCVLAKLVHGNIKKRDKLVIEFLDYIQTNNMGIEISKNNVSKHISQMAKWNRNVGNKKWQWIINPDIADKYNIDVVLPDVQENINKENLTK